LAAAACFAALASLVLLAVIRGNVLAEYVQSASPAVIMDGEATASLPPQSNFFDATLPYLRLTMMLLAFAMEVGAGLALRDARRLWADSGEDYDKLNQKRDAVCSEMVDRIRLLTALENAPQAFVAQFWRDFHRALEFVDIHRLGQAVMRAARALQCANLLMHFQCAGDNDNRHEGKQIFELGQKIQPEFAIREDVIQHEQRGSFARNLRERLGAIFGAGQFIFGERFLVDFVLEIVVFDDQDGRRIHVRCFSIALTF